VKHRIVTFVFGAVVLVVALCALHYGATVLAGDECMRASLFSGEQKFTSCVHKKYGSIRKVDDLRTTLSHRGYTCEEYKEVYFRDRRGAGKLGRNITCKRDVFIHPLWARRYHIAFWFVERSTVEELRSYAFFESSFDHSIFDF
jgi:hypothetical protein